MKSSKLPQARTFESLNGTQFRPKDRGNKLSGSRPASKENHILVLTPGFPKDEQDSVCIPALQVYLKALLKVVKPENITIISFQYPYTKKSYLWNGITVYPMNGRNKGWFFKPFLWLKVFFLFLKVRCTKKINVIHSFWYAECAFIGSVFSLFYKIPHICTFMGQDALSKNTYAKIIFKKPYIVALSDFHANTITQSLKITPDKIIPWGIEKYDYSKNINERSIDILGVGSLISVKNYSLFIDIIFELVKENKTLKCVIIGEGEEYDLLQNKINKLGLSNNLELKGGMQREEVLEYMKQSKVLLHTSNYESFGMVFIEALGAGVRIVSKPVGCYHRSDNWKIGNNKAELKEAVSEIQQNERVIKTMDFDIASTAKSYMELYNFNLL